MAEITLGYTTLTAPFDGVILVRQAELGEVVSPGAAIVTLADIDHVWLRAYVNEPDVGKIRLGEKVRVTTDSYLGKEYPGRVSFLSEAAEFTPKSVETHAERGDACLSHPYRHRQSVARAGSRPAGRCQNSGAGDRPVMSEPAQPVIEVRDLTKRFRGVAAAVQGLTLDCAKGEVFGFVGPDGAGKTTIMRLLAAVMAPDEGSIAGELRLLVAAEITRPETSRRLNALHQLDHETHADGELASRVAARTSPLHGANHTLAQIVGIRFSHPSRPPARPQW